MRNNIDIVVGYYKPSLIFQSEALKPMHLGKAISKYDLGIRGDDTGDNISEKNKWYAADTGFYWLWKNSNAKIKGLMHYHRFLDLRSPGEKERVLVLEDIKNPGQVVSDLGLDEKTISTLMEKKGADILIRQQQNIRDDFRFQGSIEEHYKASHIVEYWDYMMEIIKMDFQDIYPTAQRVADGDSGHFDNLCIMRAELFNAMCEFRFAVLKKLDEKVDINRPEIAGGWIYTARYAAFLAERLTMIYVEHLRERGKKILEFPAISIVSKNISEECEENTYSENKTTIPLEPVFGKDAIAIMLATNDNYALYTGVMIQSIKENAAKNRNYDIVVVGNLSDNMKKLLRAMAEKNVSVRVVDISPVLEDIDLSIFSTNGYFTVETYYRFFIPQLFHRYEKVLYLDVDMVTLRDVAELFDTDMGDNWWAATRDSSVATVGFLPTDYGRKFIPYLKKTLRMDSAFDYFQAGVMVWNVKQCIKDRVYERLIDRLKEVGTPMYVDQDIMNSLANGKHIYWINANWNVMWCLSHWTDSMETIAYKTVKHNLNNPYIIHFCSPTKPWDEPGHPNAGKFWRYACQTPFYKAILSKALFKMVTIQEKHNQEIRKCKRKAKQYQILQALTFNIIKSFRRRKKRYHNRIKQLLEYSPILSMETEK